MAIRLPHATREMEGEGVPQAPDLEVRWGDQPMTRGLRGSTGHADLREGTSRAVTALLPSPWHVLRLAPPRESRRSKAPARALYSGSIKGQRTR